MLQEIKYRLFNIFLNHKKKLVLLAFVVFVGLFIVPQATNAFVLDLANVQLDALDFIDDSILRWLVHLALIVIESVTLLNISAGLLDWAAQLPINLSGNELINAGWGFTSGLANIAFILIFVVIALAYIFNLENFGMKKALPKLIIIALLVNFSLLFVKILSDVGWLFQNSFSNVFFAGGGGLATNAVSTLTQSTLNILPGVIAVPALYAVVALIPYANVIALTVIFASVIATGGGPLLGLISQTIMVTVFNFTFGFLFLSFAALFLVRIAAIWLLAIFGPLAFVAYILPSTKHFFDQWLKALVQWVFLGVYVFFLLGLGLMLFGVVAPGKGQTITISGEFGSWKFFDTFYKYIFLVIYMIVVFVSSKKMVPIGSQMILGGVSKLVMGSQKVAAGFSRKVGMGATIREGEGAVKAARHLEAIKIIGDRRALTGREKIAKGWWEARMMGRSPDLLKAEVKKLKTQQMIEAKDKALKNLPKDPEDRKAALEAALLKIKRDDPEGLKRFTDRPKIAAIIDLMDGRISDNVGKEFMADAIKGGADREKISIRRPDLAQEIMQVVDPDKVKETQEAVRVELNKEKLSSEDFQKRLSEETRKKLIEELLQKVNPEELSKKMQTEAAKIPQVIEAILNDQTKLNYFGKNGKLEMKRQIAETIQNTPQITNNPKFKDQLYNMTISPNWPLDWEAPTPASQRSQAPNAPSGWTEGPGSLALPPDATRQRPQRPPRPKREK